jgi:hypothetical protein
MFKLIAKRGIIQNHVKTKSVPVDFKINTLDVECRWQNKSEDLEINDDVLLIGCMGKDEYQDPLFFVFVYFNITKNKRSSTKPRIIRLFFGSILAIILTILFWFYSNNFVITILFAFVELIALFASLYNLIAYQILEKEIKKLL